MNQKNVSFFKKSPEKKEITTVVPNKKIPQLNPLKKSNNSTGLKSLKIFPVLKMQIQKVIRMKNCNLVILINF